MIKPVQTMPQQELEAKMVTRGQKQRMEQKEETEKRRLGEAFVEEGSSMNNTITEQEKEIDADTESISDWQSAWEGYFKEKRRETVKAASKEEEQIKIKDEPEEEEEIDERGTQDIEDDNIINEPNFIWNESKETRWGKCYFQALGQDPLFGKDKKIRHPFYKNEDGFILHRNPSQGQNRVYIPDGILQIGSPKGTDSSKRGGRKQRRNRRTLRKKRKLKRRMPKTSRRTTSSMNRTSFGMSPRKPGGVSATSRHLDRTLSSAKTR